MDGTAWRLVAVCWFACGGLLAGCAPLSGYARGRAEDLADCVRVQAAAGLGLYLEAEVTSFVQPAAGLLDVNLAPRWGLGWDPRANRPHGTLRTAAFPSLLAGWPAYGYGETAAGYGDTHPYLRGAIAPLILMGNHHTEQRSVSLFWLHELIPNARFMRAPEEPPLADVPLADHFWIGTSGTALALSFDAGVNPYQIIDFVVGIAGLDLLGDD